MAIKYEIFPNNRYSDELLLFFKKLNESKDIVVLTFKDGTHEFYNVD
jgi:hypothetical protein